MPHPKIMRTILLRLLTNQRLIVTGCLFLFIFHSTKDCRQNRPGNIMPHTEDRAWDGCERREMGGSKSGPKTRVLHPHFNGDRFLLGKIHAE